MLQGDKEKPDKVWMGKCFFKKERKGRWWIKHRKGTECDKDTVKMKRGDGNWLSRFSTCTCHPANWSGEDKEERGVSHIRAFSGGQFMSGSNETSLSPPPSQLCNSDVSQTGKTKLYPFGGTRNWPCVQTKSKRLALLCFGWASLFFSFIPTRPFKSSHPLNTV